MTIRPDYGSLVDLEEKAVTEGSDCWTITGYGSIFNNTDLGNDAVVPGAFAKSLRNHGMPLLLFNHKMEDAPIGTIVDAKEDKRGLWFKAELPKDDSFVAGRIVPQLKRRGLKGTSIGYRATQSERRKSDNVRLLKEVRLYEISVVNMPMNPEASVETVKGLVDFQELNVDCKASTWNAEEALKRLRDKFGDSDEIKRAFLYVNEDRGLDALDAKLLIADVDENGCLVANHLALYKASAAIAGARGGVKLPEDAVEAVKDHLGRYYKQMNLGDPFKSLGIREYDALTEGEREVRLKSFGISDGLAKRFIQALRDAGRSQSQRDAVTPESMKTLLDAFGAFAKAASAHAPQTT